MRLTEIEARLASNGRELTVIRSKLADHDERFNTLDARFDAVEATLTEVLRRLPEPPSA